MLITLTRGHRGGPGGCSPLWNADLQPPLWIAKTPHPLNFQFTPPPKISPKLHAERIRPFRETEKARIL